MRCLPGRTFTLRLLGLALLAGAWATPTGLYAADWFNLSKGKVVQAEARNESRGAVQLVVFNRRSECCCKGCCLKHGWAPYYCGLESYHRPYYGEPGWREWWKAEKCGLWRKHDMSCYNCPQQYGSW